MVRMYPRKEAYTTRVELLSLQASMVRSAIKRRTVRVLQLNSSAASGIDKSSFFMVRFVLNSSLIFLGRESGIRCIMDLVFVDIKNSEPITVCEPDVDGL